jgi:hypothetical protein
LGTNPIGFYYGTSIIEKQTFLLKGANLRLCRHLHCIIKKKPPKIINAFDIYVTQMRLFIVYFVSLQGMDAIYPNVMPSHCVVPGPRVGMSSPFQRIRRFGY